MIFAQFFRLEGLGEFDAFEQIFQINQVAFARLFHQIGASDQLLRAMESQTHRPDADFVDDLFEEVDQRVNRFVVIARRVFLESRLLRLLDSRMMRGDADMARALVAFAATGASDRRHRHRAEADAVGAEQHQLDHVRARFDSAVGPDFDAVAQSGFEQRAMSFLDANLDRHSDVTQRVFARRSGAAVVAADGDDVGARFGDAGGDWADEWHRRNFDRNLSVRVRGLEFCDHLRQVFNRIDVVIVRRREQINAARRVARLRDQLGDFHSGQVPAFAGFGALADFDLDEIGAVEQVNVDAEAARSDLLSAILFVPAHHIGDFAAFAVHRHDLQTLRGFGVSAESGFALRAE
ncbi:MAG: hypothetical protein JMDDDDMK_04242 [Acidobacteria bacterium]|nr:hypothetical protein [Acidobacteriota bacterium]